MAEFNVFGRFLNNNGGRSYTLTIDFENLYETLINVKEDWDNYKEKELIFSFKQKLSDEVKIKIKKMFLGSSLIIKEPK